MEYSVFDVFFRKCPFQGEFANFAGLGKVIKFIQNYKLTEKEINYCRTILPDD